MRLFGIVAGIVLVGSGLIFVGYDRDAAFITTVGQPHSQQCPVDAHESREVDLGLLPLGKVASCTIFVTNRTSVDIQVIDVKQTCGCETSEVRVGSVIRAGETSSITYSLSKYGVERQTGVLTLLTNSTNEGHRVIALKLSAIYPRKLWSEPEEILLVRNDSGHIEPCELRVHAADDRVLGQFVEAVTTRGLVSVTRREEKGSNLVFVIRPNFDKLALPANDYVTFLFADVSSTRLDVRVRIRSSADTRGKIPPTVPNF